MTVARFCEITGIPWSSWHRWQRAGSAAKGPWPTPAQDAVEADAKTLAADWEGWGHRKLAEPKRVGIGSVAAGPAGDSTMHRVPARNGLSLPANRTAEVRRLAGARAEAFIDPPQRRNRLWQAGFCEYETDAAGKWNLGAVADYWAKTALACEAAVPKTAADAIAFFQSALAEVQTLLGVTCEQDLAGPHTGHRGRLRTVTDNGPRFKSGRFAARVASKRHIDHIRTPNRAPHTNGDIERFLRPIKHERLYRRDIGDSIEPAAQADAYRAVFNHARPHEAIATARPPDRYRQPPRPENVSDT